MEAFPAFRNCSALPLGVKEPKGQAYDSDRAEQSIHSLRAMSSGAELIAVCAAFTETFMQGSCSFQVSLGSVHLHAGSHQVI